jgi:peptide/nickel transport system substrate-binding protein
LTVQDFLRTAERDLRLTGPVEGFDLVIGGAACIAAHCDLSRGIVVDDAADTVTFHLTAPDPEFLQQLAAPAAVAVPAGTPEDANATRPLPATGPYEIASYSPSRLVRLVRNRTFTSGRGRPNRTAIQMKSFGESAPANLRR